MKKIVALMLIIVTVFLMVSCKPKNKDNNNNESNNNSNSASGIFGELGSDKPIELPPKDIDDMDGGWEIVG